MPGYEYYIKFTTKGATASESAAYINKIVYIAFIGDRSGNENIQTEEQFTIINSVEEVNALTWLGLDEKEIITKAFGYGLQSLYLRGVINEQWGQAGTIALEEFKKEDGNITLIDNLAYTIVLSPYLSKQVKPANFKGVLVNSVGSPPDSKPAELTAEVLDELKESKYDGKALSIFSKFLASPGNFTNLQLQAFNNFNAIDPSGLINTLKENGTTFLFNDGANKVLGMFTVGGKAAADPYISELFRFTTRQELKSWIQTFNPIYNDSNLKVIESIIDKIGARFLREEKFQSFKKTIVPLRDEQSPLDIESFLVNNVEIAYNLAGAIWSINIEIFEEV